MFEGLGMMIKGVRYLSPKEALQVLCRNGILLDVRKAYETNFREFDVPRVEQITHKKGAVDFQNFPRDLPLILGDNVGLESKKIAHYLVDQGFSNVAVIIGGMVEWFKQGLPMNVDRDFEMVGQCSCKLKPKNPKKKR